MQLRIIAKQFTCRQALARRPQYCALLRGKPTVRTQQLARDERSARRKQEADHLGDFIRLAEASHRNRSDEIAVAHLVRPCDRRHRCDDRAGPYGIDANATWTHSNFKPSIKWLEPFLICPRYHHWHHTSQEEAIDKNFAIHFPWIDRIFGTHYLPADNAWPHTYGLHNEKLPAGFWAQAFYPFSRRKKAA